PQMREVMVLDARSACRPAMDLTDLARTASRVGARLCLVYGVTSDEAERYGMSGVLLETSTGQHLALIPAAADPEDFEPASPERRHTDLRHRDPAWLCARKLQAHTRDCILEIIAKDQPPATQPSPWRGIAAEPALPPIIIVPR